MIGMQRALQLRVPGPLSGGATLANYPRHNLISKSRADVATAGSQGKDNLAWLDQQGEKIERQNRMELDEMERAKSVGLHIRGKAVINESGSRDENDKARHYWHRQLKLCADTGDYIGAERVLAAMRQGGHLPGPRAYHALIFTYVKGGNSLGALEAIRNEANDGIQPLPQSYTAVVHGFLREGDTDRAEAVYASNRRAGVASDASWVAITTALFGTINYERAMLLLQQGEDEGMRPDAALYESLIKYFCRQNQLDSALYRLTEMKERGLRRGKDHFSPLVIAHALAGEIDEAEGFLSSLVVAPGRVSAATIGAFNALLQTYLTLGLPRDQLAHRVRALQKVLAKSGIALDRKGNSLLLEVAMHIEDMTLALLAFRSLKEPDRSGLQYVSDEMLAKLLFLLSTSDMPSSVQDVLACMSREFREISPQMLVHSTASGHTFLTAWLDSRLAPSPSKPKDIGEDGRPDWVVIDGIKLDPATLYAVGADGQKLEPNKMGIKELRAELAARQCPLAGNKKELARQLRSARAAQVLEDVDDSKSLTKGKMVKVVHEDQTWKGGKLVLHNVYRTEQPLPADDEMVDDEEEEDAVIDEEEVNIDIDAESDSDDELPSMGERELYARLAGQAGLDINPPSSNAQAGPHEALQILRAALNLGALPSTADMETLCAAIKAIPLGNKQEREQIADIFNDERLLTWTSQSTASKVHMAKLKLLADIFYGL